jgi:hypothetical protein
LNNFAILLSDGKVFIYFSLINRDQNLVSTVEFIDDGRVILLKLVIRFSAQRFVSAFVNLLFITVGFIVVLCVNNHCLSITGKLFGYDVIMTFQVFCLKFFLFVVFNKTTTFRKKVLFASSGGEAMKKFLTWSSPRKSYTHTLIESNRTRFVKW